jgi:hypothetical protein
MGLWYSRAIRRLLADVEAANASSRMQRWLPAEEDR